MKKQIVNKFLDNQIVVCIVKVEDWNASPSLKPDLPLLGEKLTVNAINGEEVEFKEKLGLWFTARSFKEQSLDLEFVSNLIKQI